MLEFLFGSLFMLFLIISILYLLLYIYGSKSPFKRKRTPSINDNIIINDTIHKTLHSALNVLLTNLARQYMDKIKLDIPFIKEFNINIDWDGFIECTDMRTNNEFSIFTLVVHPPLLVQIQGNLFYNNVYLPFIFDVEPMFSGDVGLDIDTTISPDGTTHSKLKIQLLEYSLDLVMTSSLGASIKLKNLEKLHKLMEYFIRDTLDHLKSIKHKINIP